MGPRDCGLQKALNKVKRTSSWIQFELNGVLLRCVGDIQEVLNVQKEGKLTNLAYITAATYGLEAEAEQIASTLKTAPPPIDPDSKFLRPPPPIQQAESNWPLLTVSRVSKTSRCFLVIR